MGEQGRGRPGATSLALLDGFELRVDGRFVSVPTQVQRLLALLAIRRRPQHRTSVAGTLWMDTPEDNASRNLRSALWRVRKVSPSLVETSGPYVSMQSAVEVDVAVVLDQAEEVLHGPNDRAGASGQPGAITALAGDLLPTWSDDWVMIERERLRQLRVHALETLCERHSADGRHAHAVEAGLAAVAVEPLRETANRVLISAYLAEGNASEAIRHYDGFCLLLDESLGIAPSLALSRLVDPASAARA